MVSCKGTWDKTVNFVQPTCFYTTRIEITRIHSNETPDEASPFFDPATLIVTIIKNPNNPQRKLPEQ